MYNLRLTEFPDGSAEVRLYNTPLFYGPNDCCCQQAEYVREPFGHTQAKVVYDFDELTPTDPEDSRRSSLARTKRLIAEYARCAVWEWFCTFTFSPEKSNRTDYLQCSKQMRTWLKNARDRKSPDLNYLAVPELHKDLVSWHYHVLLANCGKIQFHDSGIIKNGKQIYNIPGWRIGYSTATRIQDVYRVQKYILKYITKQSHILTKGMHRYFVSKHLPKPKHSYFLVGKENELQAIDDIAQNLGLTVSWIYSSSGGYVGTTYIDMHP